MSQSVINLATLTTDASPDGRNHPALIQVEYGKMEKKGDPKDSRSLEDQEPNAGTHALPVDSRRGGFGTVARYIKAYGGMRRIFREREKELNRLDAEMRHGEGVASEVHHAHTYHGPFSSFHDWPGKFPQSCCEYVAWKDFKLKALFAYLREKEWTLQDDLVRMDEKEKVLGQLEAIEAVLLWMATNIENDGL
jgi:hypothetical protein